MDNIKNLEKTLKDDLLIELNEEINGIKNALDKKKNNKDLKKELKYLSDVKKYFDEVLLDIENKTITEEQAKDILDGLEEMKVDNQEV